jgi:hypothetical protein
MTRRLMGCLGSAALALSTLAPACGPDDAADPAASTGATGSFESWVAVLAVAADPNDLDVMAAAVLEVAGSATLVSPGICFEELPQDVAVASDYVLAVFSSDHDAVLEIASRTGLEPVFVGEVRQLCVD